MFLVSFFLLFYFIFYFLCFLSFFEEYPSFYFLIYFNEGLFYFIFFDKIKNSMPYITGMKHVRDLGFFCFSI